MYNSWTETRTQIDQGLEAEQTMTRQRRQQWQQVIGRYRRLPQALLAPQRRTPTTPLIVQPGDAYFLGSTGSQGVDKELASRPGGRETQAGQPP